MRKIINIIFFILVLFNLTFILILILRQVNNKAVSPPDLPETTDVLGLPQQENEVEFIWNTQTMKANWIIVTNLENLSLHSNLEQKLPGSVALNNNNCAALVNAGFYSKTNTHLGLFISNSVQVSDFQTNQLLNAVLSINSFYTPRITATPPTDELLQAVQSGPLLIENTAVKTLSLINDKQARRIIGAVTGDNNLLFIVVYEPSNSLNGPLLSDLPQIINKISNDQNLNIADALNLDGGSASAFYQGSKGFSELSPIGGYFCIK